MRRLVLSLLVAACFFADAYAHGDLAIRIAEVKGRLDAAPGDAKLYLQRGELYRSAGDWDRAAADYDRAAAADPTMAAVDLCRGAMLLQASRPASARQALLRFVRATPDNARGLALLAASYSATNGPREAAGVWDRALAAASADEPLLPDWYRAREDARRRAGLPSRARPQLRLIPRIVENDPAAPQPQARLLRGPYLQMATPDSIVIRWRTDVPTNSAVGYGVLPGRAATNVVDRERVVEHVVRLTGLEPGRRYGYAVGSSSQLLAGGDSTTSFLTPPPRGTAGPTRVWILGDSGTADANAARVRDAFLTYAGGVDPDVWLMLGDNAYDYGTDDEYQRAVFEMYAPTLRRSALWPTLGNHDGYSADSSTQSGPYYAIFTLPRNAEAGGVASDTEAYYSFDHANIHFVCLDSYGSSREPGSPMLLWLERDLAANTQPWLVAFWHHPPYSKGSHDSDWETELVEMRENVVPILEAHGVDLILSGHSHAYERSVLLDGHYGASWTLTQANKIDAGDGRPLGSGAYRKPAAIGIPHEGTVYAVAGSSGQLSGGSLDHPAMWVSLEALGSMVLDVRGGRLDALFLDDDGVARDTFTISKEVPSR